MGKAEAFLEWAKGWPYLQGYLKLNALTVAPGEASVNPVASERIIRQYIDGSADRVYRAQMRLVLHWSDGYDAVNADADALANQWAAWVNSQYDLGNLPVWEGCEITDIRTAEDQAALNIALQDESSAVYLFTCEIYYTE